MKWTTPAGDKLRIAKNKAGDYRIERSPYGLDSDCEEWKAVPLGLFRAYDKAKEALEKYLAENSWEEAVG